MIKSMKRPYLKVAVLCLMVSFMSIMLPQARVPVSAAGTLLFRSGFEPNAAGVWNSGMVDIDYVKVASGKLIPQ